MTTPDNQTATLQVAPADPAAERKATTKAHTAPRKRRVAPAKGKSGKMTTSAQKAPKGATIKELMPYASHCTSLAC